MRKSPAEIGESHVRMSRRALLLGGAQLAFVGGLGLRMSYLRFVSFKGEKPSLEQIKADWAAFSGRAQELKLPSAPRQFLHYFEEADRPQTKLDRMLEGGMAVSIGRLRPDTQYDYKFVCLSHNTLRGAAGGAVLLAELLCAEGYITRK